MPQKSKYGIASGAKAYVSLRSQQDQAKARERAEKAKAEAAEALKAKENKEAWEQAITTEGLLGTGADVLLTDLREGLPANAPPPDRSTLTDLREKAGQEAEENEQLNEMMREQLLEALYSLDVSDPKSQKGAFDECEAFAGKAIEAGKRQAATIAARNKGLTQRGFKDKRTPTPKPVWTESSLAREYNTQMKDVERKAAKIKEQNEANQMERDRMEAAAPNMSQQDKNILFVSYPIRPVPKKPSYGEWKKSFLAQFKDEPVEIDYEQEAATSTTESLLEAYSQ
jgi:hypothetical protein